MQVQFLRFISYRNNNSIKVFPIFIFHYYDDVSPDDLPTIISNVSDGIYSDWWSIPSRIHSFSSTSSTVSRISLILPPILENLRVIFRGEQRDQFVHSSLISFRITEFKEVAISHSRNLQRDLSSSDLLSVKVDEKGGKVNKGAEFNQDDSIVCLSGVSYAPPTEEEELVSGKWMEGRDWEWRMDSELTISVAPSHRLLITGPSGVGKTSLLRCMAQLWPIRTGERKR